MRYRFPAIVLSCCFLFALSLRAEEAPLAVGILTELSGPAALIGEDCRRGIDTGVRAFAPASARLRFVYGDSHDDAAAGVSEFNKMAQTDGVKAVIVTRSKIALPVNPVAARLGMPIIGGVGHPKFLESNPNSIRLFPSAPREGSFLAGNAVRRLGIRRVSMVTLQDDWTLALSAAFSSAFEQAGGTVVSKHELLATDVDFGATLLKVRQENPEAVFVNLLIGQAGPFVKKMRELGLHQKLISNYWIQTTPTIEAAGADALEGAVFAQVETERPRFLETLRSLYPDAKVTPALYLCYTAVSALVQIESAANADAKKLAAAVVADRDVPLLDSTLSFREREAQLELVLKTLRHGVVSDLSPSER